MKTIQVYELIQWLTQFDCKDKLIITNDSIYVINSNTEVTEDDIEEYENDCLQNEKL